MADLNSQRFTVVKQTTPGTTPTDPDWLTLKLARPGVSGGPQNRTVESQVITPNRNPPGQRLIAPGSGITIPFEAHYDTAGAFWSLLLSSMQAGTPAVAASQVTGVSGSSGNLAATGIHTGVEVGDIIRVGGGPNGTKFRRVTSTSTDSIGVDTSEFDGESNLVVDRGIRAKNGTVQDYYSMMLSLIRPNNTTGLHDLFMLLGQETIESMSLALTAQSIITGQFQTIGVGADPLSLTDLSPGTPTYDSAGAVNTNAVMDGTNNVPEVRVDGVDFGVQSINVSWRNGNAPRSEVGMFNATSIASGQFRGEGSITAFADDVTQFNKALAGTNSQLQFTVWDQTDGNAFCFSFPHIRYGNPTVTGQDRDVIMTLPFQFEQDPEELIGMRVLAYPTTVVSPP